MYKNSDGGFILFFALFFLPGFAFFALFPAIWVEETLDFMLLSFIIRTTPRYSHSGALKAPHIR